MIPVVLRGRREAEVWRVIDEIQEPFTFSKLSSELKKRGIRDDHLAMILRSLEEKGLIRKEGKIWIPVVSGASVVAVDLKYRRIINIFSFLLSFVLLMAGNVLASVCTVALALLYAMSDELLVLALPENVVYVRASQTERQFSPQSPPQEKASC